MAEAFKCKHCGVVSPHEDPCFRCGSKEKERVQLPDFPNTKKGRRRRFGGSGGTIIRIGP